MSCLAAVKDVNSSSPDMLKPILISLWRRT